MTIQSMLDKYQKRFDECDNEWTKCSKRIRDKNNPPTPQETTQLTERMEALNIQLGTYECIIKDLKEYLDENEIGRRI